MFNGGARRHALFNSAAPPPSLRSRPSRRGAIAVGRAPSRRAVAVGRAAVALRCSGRQCRRRRRAAAAYGAAVCTYYSCWPSKLLRKKYDEATATGSGRLQPTSATARAAGSGGTTTERTATPVAHLVSRLQLGVLISLDYKH